MRIEQGCLVDFLLATRDDRFDGQQLRVDVRLVDGRTLRREPSEIRALHTVTIDEAGDFDNGFGRQVFDETVVQDVTGDRIRIVCDDGFHDAAAEFVGLLVRQDRIFTDVFVLLVPVGDDGAATVRRRIQRDVVFIDEFRIVAFDPIGHVFGGMFGGFRDVIAEFAHDFKAHHVGAFFRFWGFAPRVKLLESEFFDFWIDVLSVVNQFQKPCLMVDARDACLEFRHVVVFFNAERLEKAADAGLDGMAEADRLDGRVAQQQSRQCAHGIRIIQKPRIRTDFRHVFREMEHVFARTEGAEETTNAKRVRDGLTETVFRRNREINGFRNRVVPYANGVDCKIRPAQCFLSVFDTAIGLDGRLVAVDIAVQRRKHRFRLFQPLRIDVVESDFRVLQSGSAEDVAKDVFAENGTACAKECDFCHNAWLLF